MQSFFVNLAAGPGGFVRIMTVVIAIFALFAAYLFTWAELLSEYADRDAHYPPFDWWVGAHIAALVLLELWAWNTF